MLFTLMGSGRWNAIGDIKEVANDKGLEIIKELHCFLSSLYKQFGTFAIKHPEYIEPCKNDVMLYMSIMENALRSMDEIYAKNLHLAYTGELQASRRAYEAVKMIFEYKDKKGVSHEVTMEPSIIEGYLQMFGSMGKAAPHMAEYCRYEEEKDRKDITDKELKALRKKYANEITIHDTAIDFAASHRYRTNKESFDAKDIEYAFKQLPDMEKAEEGESVTGPMIMANASPSAMVQALIFEPAFRGVASMINEEAGKQNNNEERIAFLETCLLECVQKEENKKELRKILKFLCDGKGKDEGQRQVTNRFMELFVKSYIPNMLIVVGNWGAYTDQIIEGMKNKKESAFITFIYEMINQIMIEKVDDLFGFIRAT